MVNEVRHHLRGEVNACIATRQPHPVWHVAYVLSDGPAGRCVPTLRPVCGPPRGVTDLGQLQDHYHQNDNDQDPDDGPDDSSVHFVSFDPRVDPPLQIRSLNTSLWLASTSEPGPGLFSRT